MKAIIITIGDELLIGQVVDTNSAWMAQKLTLAGYEVIEVITISDNADQIKSTIDHAFANADIVLTSGGIGPTKDDITKATLCEYFGTKLVFDESVLENIKQLISNSFSLNELTKNQAYVPESCTVIQNRVGTAPITWFEHAGKVLVSTPGVPYEMQYNVENEVIPRLQSHFATVAYLKKIYIVAGYSESLLAMHLEEFENNMPDGFGLAYLPTPGIIKLRLFVLGEERQEELNSQSEKLELLLGKSIIANRDLKIEEILGKKLLKNNLTLATAESCTGGNISHLITSISGSSGYYEGGVVSYSYECKKTMLGVSNASLDKYGAVSEQVVLEMAQGVKTMLNTDCAIAVSGIAGPAGGTDEKPVGTVWVCTQYGDATLRRKYQLGKYREANIIRASNIAMLQLLEML